MALVNVQTMPVKATPYRHQREAYRFVCGLFDLVGEKQSSGATLLVEMGTGKTITTAMSERMVRSVTPSSLARRPIVSCPLLSKIRMISALRSIALTVDHLLSARFMITALF